MNTFLSSYSKNKGATGSSSMMASLKPSGGDSSALAHSSRRPSKGTRRAAEPMVPIEEDDSETKTKKTGEQNSPREFDYDEEDDEDGGFQRSPDKIDLEKVVAVGGGKKSQEEVK